MSALRRPHWQHPGDNLPGSFALALAMHLLLFGAMTLAVQWRTQPSAPVVAELWSALPALPEPVPQVVPPPPAPKAETEPEKPADIVVQQEKKEEQKKPEPRREERKPEAKKPEARVEAKKTEIAPRPQSDLDRIMAQAGSTAPSAAGAQAGVAASGVRGSDSGYSARVVACIKPHIVFAVPEGTGANVYSEFRIELLPDASVGDVRLLRSSGLPGYDAAAERAIRRCDPFPRRSDGTLDRTIVVRMYPVEPR